MKTLNQQKSHLAKRSPKVTIKNSVPHAVLQQISESHSRFIVNQKFHLCFLYSTPFSRLQRAPASYGVDIWVDHKKVLPYWRKPEQLIHFDDAEWMNKLVPGSYINYDKNRKSKLPYSSVVFDTPLGGLHRTTRKLNHV